MAVDMIAKVLGRVAARTGPRVGNPFGGGGPIVSDTFTRADNAAALGNAETGQSWIVLAGTAGVIGGQGYFPVVSGANNTGAVIETGVSRVTVQLTLIVAATARLMFSAVDASNYFICDATIGGGGQLYRFQAGVYTALGNLPAFAVNDVLAVTRDGSSITVFRNGVSILSATDAFQSSATKHGFGASNTSARIDNFSVTAL